MYEDDDFEWNASDEEEFRKEQDRINNHPLMLKAKEIFDLSRHIYESIDAEKDELNIREQLLADASILAPKFAGAEGGGDYILKMENAVIMKIHARNLLAFTSGLQMEEVCPEEYLHLLRNEIENFRRLFLDWIKGFDNSDLYDDGWGLFID